MTLDDAARMVAEADTVAFGGVGFAGETMPVTEAYQRLRSAGPEARGHIRRLLDRATPAGKVYAATLLGALDANAGRAAWRRLMGEKAEITTFAGCLMNRTTLGTYAAEALRTD